VGELEDLGLGFGFEDVLVGHDAEETDLCQLKQFPDILFPHRLIEGL
jgi:hypothetical protein